MGILSRIFGRPEDQSYDDDDQVSGHTFLIVGLGNPGRKYAQNRHNIGFMAIDELARSNNIKLGRVQNRALVGDYRLGDRRIILAKPQTFMNSSGDAVGPLAKFYKLSPEQVLVIYDELDLPFGTVRIRPKGGAGGHNGMRSIINHLGESFPRIRLGIGRPPGRMPVQAFVLQDFGKRDQLAVSDMINQAGRAAETFVRDNIDQAMSRYNGTVLS